MANLDRVKAINATIASSPTASKGYSAAPSATGGGVTSSGQIVQAGGKVVGTARAVDMPGYNPATDPTSSVYKRNLQQGVTADATTAQDIQKQTLAQNIPSTTLEQPTPKPTDITQATPEQIKAVQEATKTVEGIAQQAKAIFESNKTAQYDTGGEATSAITKAAASVAPTVAATTTPTPSAGYMDAADPVVSQSIQEINDLKTQVDKKSHTLSHIQALAEKEIADLDIQQMNLNNIMDGQDDTIRDEITKAGGSATESQVQGIANARNKDLIKQYNSMSIARANMINSLKMRITLAQGDVQMATDNYNTAVGMYDMEQKLTTATDTKLQKILTDYGPKQFSEMYANNPKILQLAGEHLYGDSTMFTDPKKVSAMETYKDRQAALSAMRLSISSGAGSGMTKEDTNSSLAEMVLNGSLPPSMISAYGGTRNAVLAMANTMAKERGSTFSPSQAETEYQAAKRFATNLNSSQMVRYQGLASSVVNTIDEVGALTDEMKLKGIPIVNKAKLTAYVQATGADSENGQLATRYLAAVNTLKEEFANLAQGGYAPTEAAWSLANKQINENYDLNKMKASLYEVQRLINYRTAAFQDIQPILPGGAKTTTATLNNQEYYLASDGKYYPKSQ